MVDRQRHGQKMLAGDTDAMLFFDQKFIANWTGLSAHTGESHLMGVFTDPTVRAVVAAQMRYCHTPMFP